MDMTLTAVYEQVSKSEGDGYVAYVEELPGAISEEGTMRVMRMMATLLGVGIAVAAILVSRALGSDSDALESEAL